MEESPTPVTSAEAPPPPPAEPTESSDGFFSRLVGVVVEPSPTFGRIAARPDWLLPMILVVVTSLVAGWVTFSKIEPNDLKQSLRTMLTTQLEKSSVQLSDAQLDQAVDRQVGITRFMGQYGAVVTVPVWALLGTLYYFVFFKAFGATATYKQTLSFYLWGMIPLVGKALVTVIVVLAKGSVAFVETPELVRANLSFLVDPSSGSKMVYGLLAALDLFAVWALVLRIVGARRLPGVSKTVAIVAAVIGFVVAVGFMGYQISKMV